jgi:hypothetical protein
MLYRTNDPTKWGAGKGGNLTPAEVDENFWDLDQRTAVLEAGSPDPVGIDHVSVTGNTFTIVLTDSSTQGPFNLPAAKFNLVGEWAPNTLYVPNSFITEAGKTYLILYPHTSAAFFDPGANDGAGHDYYGLLPFPDQPIIEFIDDGWQPNTSLGAFKLFSVPDDGVYLSLRTHVTASAFDRDAQDGGGNSLYKRLFASIESNRARIQFQFAGRPPTDGSFIMVYINDDPRDLSFPNGWTGSAAHLDVACSALIAWTLEYAGDVIGTIAFAPGDQLDGDTGQYATISGPGTGATPIENLNLLKIRSPAAADATAKFLTVALVGTYLDPP